MTTPALPKFHSRTFLQEHAQFILDFYEPRVVDPNNGFYQCYKDDGEIYDKHTRHLVSSTRFIFNYATAYRLYNKDHYRDWALHGLDYLQRVHRQSNNNYAWEIYDGKVTDGRAMAYGHAFVMLCAASCIKAGIG
jgi:mannose/cellobiose epimerase-like protein (N-acyl-D-glucosamine 2-epimerase family)